MKKKMEYLSQGRKGRRELGLAALREVFFSITTSGVNQLKHQAKASILSKEHTNRGILWRQLVICVMEKGKQNVGIVTVKAAKGAMEPENQNVMHAKVQGNGKTLVMKNKDVNIVKAAESIVGRVAIPEWKEMTLEMVVVPVNAVEKLMKHVLSVMVQA